MEIRAVKGRRKRAHCCRRSFRCRKVWSRRRRRGSVAVASPMVFGVAACKKKEGEAVWTWRIQRVVMCGDGFEMKVSVFNLGASAMR